jgi:hypothetical protein
VKRAGGRGERKALVREVRYYGSRKLHGCVASVKPEVNLIYGDDNRDGEREGLE